MGSARLWPPGTRLHESSDQPRGGARACGGPCGSRSTGGPGPPAERSRPRGGGGWSTRGATSSANGVEGCGSGSRSVRATSAVTGGRTHHTRSPTGSGSGSRSHGHASPAAPAQAGVVSQATDVEAQRVAVSHAPATHESMGHQSSEGSAAANAASAAATANARTERRRFMGRFSAGATVGLSRGRKERRAGGARARHSPSRGCVSLQPALPPST